MAEALGLAAGVIAVIDLSAKVASRCSEYYGNVKNARDDIERLQSEAQGLKATLERLQSLYHGPNGVKLLESQTLYQGVEDCKKQLAQLKTKLEPRTTNRLMSRCGMRALKWPLKSKEVDGIMKKLRNLKDNISFSLQVDQEYVLLFMFQVTESNNISTGYNFSTSTKRLSSINFSLPTTPHMTPMMRNTMLNATQELEWNSFGR